MVECLKTIIKDNWSWRKQIWHLAIFDLVKRSRGAALGWAWLFIKPAVYIFCFWFALDVGLRTGGNMPEGAPPYILWLCSGIIPWFYMQEMLGQGVDIMHRYPYLVNKIKFPLGAISSIYAISTLIVQLMLMVVLFVIYFACGMPIDLYLLQVPVLLIIMVVFWDIFSIFCSMLSAISHDFSNLMHALSTPFFWLSGAIFDVSSIGISWVQTVFYFNPITFFTSGFRAALYDKTWIWENTGACLGFVAVFVVTLLCMLFVYKKFAEEVPDVL